MKKIYTLLFVTVVLLTIQIHGSVAQQTSHQRDVNNVNGDVKNMFNIHFVQSTNKIKSLLSSLRQHYFRLQKFILDFFKISSLFSTTPAVLKKEEKNEPEHVQVPIIDISALRRKGASRDEKLIVAKEIGKACEEVGFFVIRGHGVDAAIIDNAWKATRDFFDLSVEEKMTYVKPQHEYPFGYTKMGGELLSAGKAAQNKTTSTSTSTDSDSDNAISNLPDLKEMFSLGPQDPAAGFPPRIFPTSPTSFEPAWTAYYDTMAILAADLLRGFALALELSDENFFDSFITHHASALRALNYPHMDGSNAPVPGQLRASAHTDYGSLTILRSDSPGLQVSKDKSPPSWSNVPFEQDGFVVNLGDLMQRWTNDVW